MDDEQYINIEDGLSVGAIKYVDPNEMITEEEFNYIKNKVPELEEIVNTWEAFKSSGGEISGNLLAIQLATKSISNNYRWAEETHDTGYKIISSNTNPSTGDWREEFIMAYDGFAPKNDKVLGTSENPWNDIFIKGVSKNTTGYSKLPNGLIMQWGTVWTGTETGKKNYKVTYPIYYPNNVLYFNAQTQGATYDYSRIKCIYGENDASEMNIVEEKEGPYTTMIRWFSIGY